MEHQEKVKKRLKIRSWRRGMRETDILLGKFFDKTGNTLSSRDLDCYERLLLEDDQNIFAWISRKEKVPDEFLELIEKIIQFNSTCHEEIKKTLC